MDEIEERFHFPVELECASLSKIFSHMMHAGFSKEKHIGQVGSWTQVDFSADEKDRTLLGINRKTLARIRTGKGVNRATVERIVDFFLLEIVERRQLHGKWSEKIRDAAGRARQLVEPNPFQRNDTVEEDHKTQIWPDWAACLSGDGHPVRRQLLEHIQTCRDRVFLIMCISPEGFLPLLPDIAKAVAEGRANVHWAYHPHNEWSRGVEGKASNKSVDPLHNLQLQRLTLSSRYKTNTGRLAQTRTRNAQIDNLIAARDDAHRQREATTNSDLGHFLLYESRVFHYFMGLISLPENSHGRHGTASAGDQYIIDDVCGFIQLYTPFPSTYAGRPGLFFPAADDVSKIYARSMVEFFDKAPCVHFLDEKEEKGSVELLRRVD
ncbi:MAG: hypothetical protein RH945_12375 [Hyphomonas sp.]